MKRMLAVLICAAALAAGQTSSGGSTPQPAVENPKYLQSVIEVKHGDVNALARLLESLSPPRTTVRAHPDLNLISIGAYDPEFVKLADEIVQRYDVALKKEPLAPVRDIELTAYILVASPQGTSGDALPAGLEGVAKQLQSVFGFRDLKLLDTALIRAHEGSRGSEMSGNVTGLVADTTPAIYQLRFNSSAVRQAEGRTLIDLNSFRFGFKLPYETAPKQIGWMDLGFNTDLSIGESQKVVVGKSKFGSGNQALILVLSARVVS